MGDFPHRAYKHPIPPLYYFELRFSLLLYFLVMAKFDASKTLSLSSAWVLDLRSFLTRHYYCEKVLSIDWERQKTFEMHPDSPSASTAIFHAVFCV
jgi:hypothetical protein